MAKLNISAEQYLHALKQLLPAGPAWNLDDNCFFSKMLTLASLEFARLDADISVLINESDPQTASNTLDDWFYQWGIPDECYSDETDYEELRKELLFKIRTLGLTFVELVPVIGQACGYSNVYLDTAELFTVASNCDDLLYNSSWSSWFWTVSANEENQQFFTVDGKANEYLSTWGNKKFECLVKHFTPAYTGVIFKYGENK